LRATCRVGEDAIYDQAHTEGVFFTIKHTAEAVFEPKFTIKHMAFTIKHMASGKALPCASS